MSVCTRLTASFLLLVLLPLLVGMSYLDHQRSAAAVIRQEAHLAHTGALAAGILASYCARARSTAEAAARASVEQHPGGAPPLAGLLRTLQALAGQSLADGVQIREVTGRVVAQVGELPTTALDCDHDPASGSGGAFLSSRVPRYADSDIVGAAVVSYRLDQAFLRRIAQQVGVADLALLDQLGAVVAATTMQTAEVLAASRTGTGRTHDRIAVQVEAMPGQPFGLLLVVPIAPGPAIGWPAVLCGLLALALAGGLAVGLARLATRPMVARRAAVAQAHRRELQAGVDRLGDTLSGTHDLDRILMVVLETVMTSTQARTGMVLLLSPGQQELVVSVQRGLNAFLLRPGLSLPVEGVSGQVARLGSPVHGRVGSGPDQLQLGPQEPTVSTVLCLPLQCAGRTIGVLNLYDRSDGAEFDAQDLVTLRAFVGQAMVAVENVWSHQEAQRLSSTDGLTGLWNHRQLHLMLGREMERATRSARPVAVLMLDLDNFKSVNDVFGHQRGDAVLVELAKRVLSQVREVDVVARYGGEELVVLLPETDAASAARTAQRICDAVRSRPFGAAGEVPVSVTLSAGVAVFPAHGTTAAALLGRADEAMYGAKHAGRDQWQLASR